MCDVDLSATAERSRIGSIIPGEPDLTQALSSYTILAKCFLNGTSLVLYCMIFSFFDWLTCVYDTIASLFAYVPVDANKTSTRVARYLMTYADFFLVTCPRSIPTVIWVKKTTASYHILRSYSHTHQNSHTGRFSSPLLTTVLLILHLHRNLQT